MLLSQQFGLALTSTYAGDRQKGGQEYPQEESCKTARELSSPAQATIYSLLSVTERPGLSIYTEVMLGEGLHVN